MRKSWLLYAFAGLLILGLIFEILKSIKLSSPPDLSMQNGLGELTILPYSRQRSGPQSISGNTDDRTKNDKAHLPPSGRGDLGVSENGPSINDKDVGGEDEGSKAAHSEQKNIDTLNLMAKKASAEIERKKKAALALKKKREKAQAEKKAREKAEKERAEKGAQSRNNQDDNGTKRQNEESEQEGINAHIPGSSPFGILPPNGDDAKADTPDVDEWMRRLLNQPSLEETNNFIKYRQNNLVSPDVFYFVVQQMIEDSRQRQRELGIMALDATASYRSFILLAQFLQVEPHGSGVRSKANHALDRYTQFPQLGILEAVYHSPEASFIRERALILVSNSALINLAHSKNIENSENQTSSQPNSSDENNTQQANKLYIQRYTTILKGLESMLENPRESSQISQTLQSTIENLKNLLNS